MRCGLCNNIIDHEPIVRFKVGYADRWAHNWVHDKCMTQWCEEYEADMRRVINRRV